MIIGICGKSGSGKSTLAKKLANLINDAAYLDIDTVGHNVLMLPEVKKEIFNTFGIVESDRKALGDIVFNNRDEMDKLTNITWKYMQIEINIFLETHKNQTVILDWILLPKTQYFNMCDVKILVDVPYEVRKARAMARDNITAEKFDLREKASIDYNKKDFNYIVEEP